MKPGENDLNVQCCMVCTALANCPPYNFLCLNPLRVHHLAHCRCKICVLRVHKQGLAPTSRPRNMSIGYADLYSTKARKTNIRSYNKRNKKKNNSNNEIYFSKYAVCNSSSCLEVTTRLHVSSKFSNPTLHLQ